MCGKTPVLNRKTCYACSLEQSSKTQLSGLRNFCHDCMINPPTSIQVLDSILGKHEWSLDEAKELLKLKKLMKIALYTSQGKPRKKVKSKFPTDQIVNLAKSWIDKNYKTQWTIPQLAKICKVGRSSLMKIFKEQTGISPHEYSQQHILDEAKTLLRITSIPVPEVAKICGISTYYLNVLIKESTGMTSVGFRVRTRGSRSI